MKPLTLARRALALVVFLLVVEYLVLPQIAGTREALRTLGELRPLWLILGVALEALSLFSYSLFTRNLLPARRPTYAWLLRTDVTALGVGHLVPGGTAAANALRYRLLREGGVQPGDALVAAAVEGVGSTLVLVVILWTALVTSIPFVGVHLAYVIIAGVSAVVIAAAVLLVVSLARGSTRTQSWSHAIVHRLPARYRGRAERTLANAIVQIRHLLSDRRALAVDARWAGLNWLLDAGSLWVFLAAFGHRVDPIALLVGYGLANLVAVVPVSPGGLGVIEGVLIPALVGFGVPPSTAVLGVVSWRLFEFWAPIPVAAICYLSLRTETWRSRPEVTGAWAEFKAIFAQSTGPRTGRPGQATPQPTADGGDATRIDHDDDAGTPSRG